MKISDIVGSLPGEFNTEKLNRFPQTDWSSIFWVRLLGNLKKSSFDIHAVKVLGLKKLLFFGNLPVFDANLHMARARSITFDCF